jgi:hypothetical protein
MDRLKESISKNSLHTCSFAPKSVSGTLYRFLQTIPPPSILPEKINEESLLVEIAVFIGKKNLSLEIGESPELYQLINHAIQYGIQAPPSPMTSEDQAKAMFHNFKKDTIRARLISASDHAHRTRMHQFSECIYVGVAIDEGSIRGCHNLDFVLENPISEVHSYPGMTIRMEGGTAKEYVKSLSEGLTLISNYKINIGAVICDGNTAQVKAFNPKWQHSLPRSSIHGWMKPIIFVPCLCHRIHNAYKSAVSKDHTMSLLVNRLHSIAEECRSNVKILGALCPRHVSTRWANDYDIISFILARRDLIPRRTEVPVELLNLQKVLVVFKALILTFENTGTPLSSAFSLLENGILALEELSSTIPFADKFKASLENYTLKSRHGGIWILAYVSTPRGRLDFQQRVRTGKFHQPAEGKHALFHVKGQTDLKDPVEETIDELLSDNIDEAINEIENDTIIDLAARNETLIEAEPEEGDISDDDQESEEIAEGDLVIAPGNSVINQAREYLIQLLVNRKLSERSAKGLAGQFNDYITKKESQLPIPLHTLADDSYNWELLRTEEASWRDIADIFLRLLNCSCSEASCERTISTQRLILASRRMKSAKRLLDARLTLMRAIK